jgi:NADH:ubiquinone oxidoreductase subunit 6 (subunit J)
MDSLHAFGFYVSAALSVIGGLLVALLPDRARRAIALAVAGLGLAGLYASLSAGFAGLVALVCYAGCALLLARTDYRSVQLAVNDRLRQMGALGAGGLLVILAYSAFRGGFQTGSFSGGAVGTGAIGSLLFTQDALATEAVGALVLATLAGVAVAWRRRERERDR